MYNPLPNAPQSVSTLFSAHASVAATSMLIRSMTNELVPHELRSVISSALRYLFTSLSATTLTLLIEEQSGMMRNQVYDAADNYLRTKINPSMDRLRVSKTPGQKNFTFSFEKGEEIDDAYEEVKIRWKYECSTPQKDSYERNEKRRFELSFKKKYKDKVVDCYLPWVLSKAQKIKDEEKVVRLYSRESQVVFDDDDERGSWGYVHLEHPSTFDTLAMDPDAKRMLIHDLDRFVRRREFYKKVGKAWKRGYLLYGPPGTGKSSLIAAMANYLKFDIYDLELTSIYSNSDLRSALLSTTNRSILVIEDIDCSAEIQNRGNSDHYESSSSNKFSLSGMLNFVDGLWSSVGDERIIVFTTNHKDRLDPALLRPGRMDVHIHMSYLSPRGFEILTTNYLGVRGKDHLLYGEVQGLIESTNVTPAEVAEELMKSDDAGLAFEGLVNFLKRKRDSEVREEARNEGSGKVEEGQDAKRIKTENDDDEKKLVASNRKKALRVARAVKRRYLRPKKKKLVNN